MTTLFTNPFVPAFSGTTVAPDAMATFYHTQTSTLAPIYDDSGDPLPNPVTADAFGQFTNIYIDPTITYRVILEDRFGAVLNEVDPYTPNAGGGGGGIEYFPGDGIAINQETRTIFSIDTATHRVIWLNDFYPNTSSTDTDAWLAFAARFNAGEFGNCRIMVPPSLGRGNTTTGNYFLSQDVLFTGPYALEIDGLGSVWRITGASGRLHYKPPPSNSANVQAYPWFVVKNFVVQFGAACDTFAFWDMPFVGSRLNGTGYAENVRMAAQDTNNAGHTANGLFRIRNTWGFEAKSCHYAGKPRAPSDLINHPEQVGIVQDGVCIVTNINACEFNYVYQPVQVGIATMTGINGTFAPTSAGARGNRVIQGGSVGFIGRSDNAYGYTYSLYDVTGTFTPGTANVYDYTGATLLGTLTIASTGVYQQASEGISIGNFSNVSCCYGLQWAKPALVAANLLNIVFGDSGWAPSVGLIQADGISCLAITEEVNCLTAVPNMAALIDINNGFEIHIGGMTASNNGQGGAKFLKLRNTQTFGVDGPKIDSFFFPTDIDNTCKNGVVCNIVAESTSSGPMINTANRYNGTSLQGIRYFNNGSIGIGVDINDNTVHTWTPVITAGTGTITSYTAAGSYVFANGVFTFTIGISITNRGTAAGGMKITLPPLITGAATVGLSDCVIPAIQSTQGFPIIATMGVNAFGAGLVGIVVNPQNPTYSTFSDFTGAAGSFNYIVSGSVPIRLN